MSITLIKLAKRFSVILRKNADDPNNDPLLRTNPARIEPELTEDIDDLVKDSLHLVILLQRAFMDFADQCQEDKNSFGSKLAENALLELEDTEDALNNTELLNFDLNTESGYLDVLTNNVGMLKSVLDLTLGGGDSPFKKLDQKVHKWVNELTENIDKLHDKTMAQSPFMERYFAEPQTKMLEQVNTDVDQILEEDIHPDHPSFQPELGVWEREQDF
jgi:hypothetical protein